MASPTASSSSRCRERANGVSASSRSSLQRAPTWRTVRGCLRPPNSHRLWPGCHGCWFPRRVAGSAGVLPARRARLERGAGLGHLRPAASFRRQQYVWERGASHPQRAIKSAVTLKSCSCPPLVPCSLAGLLHPHQRQCRGRRPPVGTVPSCHLPRGAGEVPGVPRG